MDIKQVLISEIKPYPKNPRKNYGFLVPIILDKDNIIVAGHTRIKAAKQLQLKEVPVIYAENLTDKQIKAFRIMENKSQEYSYWDYDLLKEELLIMKDLNIDLETTGFHADEINFFNPDQNGKTNDSYIEWRKSGNLDYENDNETGVKTILLHFAKNEDIAKFSELINQTISERTKYLWFPKQSVDKVADLEYVEDEE